MSSMMKSHFYSKKKTHKGIELGTLPTQIFTKKSLIEFLDNNKRLKDADNANLNNSLSTFDSV
jgi:hypothetical protein